MNVAVPLCSQVRGAVAQITESQAQIIRATKGGLLQSPRDVSELKSSAGWLVACLGVVMACLSACDRPKPPGPVAAPAVPLAQRASAYAGSPADWDRFLQCWGRTNADRGADSKSVLVGITTKSSPGDEAAVVVLEKRLGIRLPKSYRDFLAVYRTRLKGGNPLMTGAFPPACTPRKMYAGSRMSIRN